MKKVIQVVVIVILVGVLGVVMYNNHNYQKQVDEEVAAVMDEEIQSKSQKEDLESMKIRAYSSFSENLAIIQYGQNYFDENGSTEEARIVAFINKKGEIQPLYEIRGGSPKTGIRIYPDYKYTAFNNGIAYVYAPDYVVQITKSDDKLTFQQFDFDDNESVLNCGGGYALVKSDDSGYSSNESSFKVYSLGVDGTKELAISYEYDRSVMNDSDDLEASYLGKGLFRVNTYAAEKVGIIDGTSGYRTVEVLEIPRADRVDNTTGFEGGEIPDNGVFVVGSIQKENPNLRKTVIVYLDDSGNLKTADLSGLWAISQSNPDGWIICASAENPGVQAPNMSYNLLTGEQHISPENTTGDRNCEFTDDGKVVMDLKGANKKGYTGVLDTDLELITEPIEEIFAKNISDGIFLVPISTGDNQLYLYRAYNEDCELLFEADQYYEIYNFQDDVAAAFDQSMPSHEIFEYVRDSLDSVFRYDEVIYLDKQGNRLFDFISYGN